MNLSTFFDSGSVARLALLAGLSPVVACLPALAASLLKQRVSAAARHLLWLSAFIGMGMCAALFVVNFRIPARILPAKPFAARTAAHLPSPSPQNSPAAALPDEPPSGSLPAPIAGAEHAPALLASAVTPTKPRRPFPWLHSLAAVWALGALSLCSVSLAGWIRLRKLVKRCHSADSVAAASLESVLAALPLPRSRLACQLSPDVRVPFVSGWLRPVIILPEAAFEWPREMLRLALIHEAAHVERNDVPALAFARLVLALYWFHPAAWLAWRQLRAEAEMAADDCVVLAEADPIDYAEGLMRLVRKLRGDEAVLFPAVGMLKGRGIEARLERILGAGIPRLAPAKGIRWAALAAVAIFFAALLVIQPIAAFTPRAVAEEPPEPSPKLALPPQELLVEAIVENDLAKVTALVNSGADPNLATNYFNNSVRSLGWSTPLYYAAELGRLAIVEYLLGHGADLKVAKIGNRKAIDAALLLGFGDVVKCLHEHGDECDPLVYAAAIGDAAEVARLLPTANAKSVKDATVAAAGCNQIAVLSPLLEAKGDPASAFKRASMTGAIEALQFLLDHGVNLKAIGDQALLIAADNRHPRSVAFLLKAGVKPDPETHAEYYPLHCAARSNDLEAVKLLLDAGANPNCVTADPDLDQGKTPIFEAAGSDNLEMVKLLIAHGAHQDVVYEGGFTPALYAAYAHAPHTLAYFLDHGADPKAVNPKWKCGYMEFALIFTGEDANRPDMHVSIAQVARDMETVKVLLDHGLDVNAPGVEGGLPLHIAVANGQTACMELLLQHGAKVNVALENGGTLLNDVLWAPLKEEWRLRVINRLFAAGLDVNTGIDNPIADPANRRNAVSSPLKMALLFQPKLVKLMLDHGARFAVEKDSAAEKMLMAATTGDLPAVQGLLAKGVSPDVSDRRGWTPLLIASIRGDTDLMRALLAAGANVNVRDALGLAPVHFSFAKYPDLTDFHLLLAKGANLNVEANMFSVTPPVYQAIRHADPTLVREILQHGASANRLPASSNNEFDPIELAAEVLLSREPKNEKRREVVKILLEFGADPNHLSRPGARSILYFPVANNSVDLVKFLLDAGVDPRKDPDGGKSIAEQAERNGNAEMKALIKASLEKAPGERK